MEPNLSIREQSSIALKTGRDNLMSSFRYRAFRWYWAGNTLAHITFLLQGVVLGWTILVMTDSALWVGLVAFAYGLPLLIISPLGGLLADRFKRQRIVFVTLSSAVLASVALAYAVNLGMVTPIAILVCSFVLGTAFAIYAPARMSILPHLVPDDMIFKATSLSYSGTRLMGFFGPVLGGFLLDATGIFVTLVVQSLLFAIAALFYVQATSELPDKIKSKSKPSGIVGGLKDVVEYLRHDKALSALIGLGLIFVPFGMPYLKLMPVYVQDVLNEGPKLLGLLVGLASLGASVSGLAIVAIGEIERKGKVILVCSMVFGLGLMLFGFIQQPLIAVLVVFLVGIFSGVFLTLSNVSLLIQSPDELRGRMMSAWGMVWGLVPFTSLLAGAVIEQVNISLVLLASGLILTLVCVLMLVRQSQLLML